MSVMTQKSVKTELPKDLLTLFDYTGDQIIQVLESALELKERPSKLLEGKLLGMIFEKPSTRTRVSFEAGMKQLGGDALYLNSNDLQLGRGEPLEDTARVLSQYVDGIMIRTFEHEKIETLAKYATIPVINGLTDLYHPCQALADLLTIYEVKGHFKGSKLVYVGDGNNVAHSLLIAAAKVGMDMTVASPEKYEPMPEIVAEVKKIAAKTGAKVVVTNDPVKAVTGADVIYTDVWTSMGQEKEQEQRYTDLQPYQVNKGLASHANPDFTFLHCLPAHRGEEVTTDVIDGPNSKVFEQAGNRLHVQKALLVALMSHK